MKNELDYLNQFRLSFFDFLKMNFSNLAEILSKKTDGKVYVHFSTDYLDFTNKEFVAEMFLSFSDEELKIILTQDNLTLVVSMLQLSVWGENFKIICWDWKGFCSYFLNKTGKTLVVSGTIIDLKIIESYCGKKLESPKNLKDALVRLKDLVISGSWSDVEVFYKKVHLPLMTRTIPALENSGIIDVLSGKKLHAYYEIEGQENGRLRSANVFSQGFVPHTMSPEIRDNLKPRDQDELFLVFDFKSMEVFMLANCSKDPLLLELCKEKDVYESLYSKIIDENSEKKDRNLVKKIFLPVIYGQTAKSLHNIHGFALDVCESIVERIDKLFPTAMRYVGSYVQTLETQNFAKDIFNRKRYFEAGKEFAVRNFSIQAPSALICLEKLNHLYFALKGVADIAYSLHDGYAVYATKDNWKKVYKLSYEALSSESDICENLRLRVACRGGRNLNDLKPLARRGD